MSGAADGAAAAEADGPGVLVREEAVGAQADGRLTALLRLRLTVQQDIGRTLGPSLRVW